MEFSALIDRLDDMLSNAKTSRRGSEARIDPNETRALIAQLRAAIPEDYTQAQWISQNREEMLAEARAETTRILEEAREERARMLSADEIAGGAERRAQEVLEEAAEQQREIRVAAEDYALAILDGLERHMFKLAEAVGRGRDRLAERRQESEALPGGDVSAPARSVEREAALA
jgi:hypothetical protein